MVEGITIVCLLLMMFFCSKQKTAYEMRIRDWSSDVCSSDLLVRQEWRRMAEAGPTESEVRDAKTYLIGSFPISLDSTGSIAATLVAMQRYDLGPDHLDRRSSLIEAVTPEDARRVAKRLLDPEALTFVVVGQPEGVEPTRPPPGSG